jgi:hypothetical protein
MSATQTLLSIVRAYTQEFGSRNVLISVPLSWESLGESLSDSEQTRLAFTTNGHIEVSAFDGAARRLHYAIEADVIVAEAIALK